MLRRWRVQLDALSILCGYNIAPETSAPGLTTFASSPRMWYNYEYISIVLEMPSDARDLLFETVGARNWLSCQVNFGIIVM